MENLFFILFAYWMIALDAIYTQEIIGYYPSLAQPENFDFSKISVVNFACFQTNRDGNIFATDPSADSHILFGPTDSHKNPSSPSPLRCSFDAPDSLNCNHHFVDQGLISLVHQNGAQIFPSVGGWDSSHQFPIVAASDATRKHFAQQCAKLIKVYDFDGIDIDWEYPGYISYGGSPDDKQHFTLLLQEIRSALDILTTTSGKYYRLTAALPCVPKQIVHIDVKSINDVLDQMHLMTYDFHGTWDEKTGANAPLDEVRACVAQYVALGATKSKINIGVPFYGRSYKNAKGLNQSHHGADTIHWPQDEGKPPYSNIAKKLNEMVSVRDEITKTQYAYYKNEDGISGMVSYDDPVAICNKVEYVLDDELNGLFIWDLTGDLMDDLSTPLLDEISLKLMFPDEHNCGDDIFHPVPVAPPTGAAIQPPTCTACDRKYTDAYVQTLLDEIRDLLQQLNECRAHISSTPNRAPSKLLNKG